MMLIFILYLFFISNLLSLKYLHLRGLKDLAQNKVKAHNKIAQNKVKAQNKIAQKIFILVEAHLLLIVHYTYKR